MFWHANNLSIITSKVLLTQICSAVVYDMSEIVCDIIKVNILHY